MAASNTAARACQSQARTMHGITETVRGKPFDAQYTSDKVIMSNKTSKKTTSSKGDKTSATTERHVRLGVLDIGSNTIHMLIVKAAPGARPEPEAQTRVVVRLMQYLKDDGSIRKSGVTAILDAVDECMKLAQKSDITTIVPIATSALREAPNGPDILTEIKRHIGMDVTVLSGADEARLTFLAARRWYGWDAGRLLVLDIGGGSLEAASGGNEDPDIAISVPAGAGRITHEFLPDGTCNAKTLEHVHHKVARIVNPLAKAFADTPRPDHVVATSKTFRSLARLAGTTVKTIGNAESWHLKRSQLEDWTPRLAAIDPDQRVALPGITPERTLQIVGGAVAADEAMKALGVDEVEICPWALREGVILHWLDQHGRASFDW